MAHMVKYHLPCTPTLWPYALSFSCFCMLWHTCCLSVLLVHQGGVYGRDYALSCPLSKYFPLLSLSCHSALSWNITTSEKHPLTVQAKIFSSLQPPQCIIFYFTILLPCLSTMYQQYPSIISTYVCTYVSISLSDHLSTFHSFLFQIFFISLYWNLCITRAGASPVLFTDTFRRLRIVPGT